MNESYVVRKLSERCGELHVLLREALNNTPGWQDKAKAALMNPPFATMGANNGNAKKPTE